MLSAPAVYLIAVIDEAASVLTDSETLTISSIESEGVPIS